MRANEYTCTRCSSIASLSESTSGSKKSCVPKLFPLHHINIFSNKIVDHFFRWLSWSILHITLLYAARNSLFIFDAPFIISELLLRECSSWRRQGFSFCRIGLTGKPETTPVDPVLNVACLNLEHYSPPHHLKAVSLSAVQFININKLKKNHPKLPHNYPDPSEVSPYLYSQQLYYTVVHVSNI